MRSLYEWLSLTITMVYCMGFLIVPNPEWPNKKDFLLLQYWACTPSLTLWLPPYSYRCTTTCYLYLLPLYCWMVHQQQVYTLYLDSITLSLSCIYDMCLCARGVHHVAIPLRNPVKQKLLSAQRWPTIRVCPVSWPLPLRFSACGTRQWYMLGIHWMFVC